jgi:hypothetical protein
MKQKVVDIKTYRDRKLLKEAVNKKVVIFYPKIYLKDVQWTLEKPPTK